MILSERHIITKSNPNYKELDRLCFLSKNLYNAGLYRVRQYFFETKEYKNYNNLNKDMVKENNPDYRSLPSKISQQVLKLLDSNYKSFFESFKKGLNPKIPKYLDKLKGRFVVTYTNQAISKTWLSKGYIKPSGLNILFPTKQKEIQQVRFIHKGYYIVMEVLYLRDAQNIKNDNDRYCSIDLGLNNLATIGSNVIRPIIINGKPLKSINQYYNKQISKIKSTNKKHKITLKRNNKISDYLHKSSRMIVNYLVSNNINTLVIGHNKEWKQSINIGRVNNQKFVNIPHSKFISMLNYKCELEGIKVRMTEESYTSKCSFIDNEEIKKQEVYLGKRIKRGLFKTFNGILINADVNGAMNILKKVVGNFKFDPIEVYSTPIVYTMKFN